MKKIISLILICLLVFVLFGCESEKTYRWEFENDYTHVTEIKVVVPPSGESFDINTCKIIKEINLLYASELMDHIEWMTMRLQEDNLSEPSQLCILIMFDNGEYDVISKVAPTHYKYDENGIIQGYSSGFVVDSDHFFSIISYCFCLD